jgi:hypothetical protein
LNAVDRRRRGRVRATHRVCTGRGPRRLIGMNMYYALESVDEYVNCNFAFG